MSTIGFNAQNPRFKAPRAAYLHVPFCRHRCGYCNFTLIAGRDDLVTEYLSAIDRELSQLETPRPVDTLFLGGGTPSHLEPRDLRDLITIARRWFQLSEGGEFSVEANPLDITPERVDLLREGGVNRISLGVQSFHDRWLHLLDRDHRQGDIAQAISLSSAAFPSVSVDLMFGVPGQTLDDWRADLESALEFAPPHISTYGLTFERGTRFWSQLQRDEIRRCPEEREREMYEVAIEVLTGAGHEHYEVSNFARPGFRCRHNETYWTGRTYFAAGPGAARHVAGWREVNHRSTTTYLRRVLAGDSPVAESEFLSAEESARERFVFGLRRLEGIDIDEFNAETGLQVAELFGLPIARFLSEGLLQQNGSRIQLTRAGLLVSDALWPELLDSST